MAACLAFILSLLFVSFSPAQTRDVPLPAEVKILEEGRRNLQRTWSTEPTQITTWRQLEKAQYYS
jgi:hypothetical protein